MKNRHVYLVVTHERDYPIQGVNDVQKHVLGAHSNLASAMSHARSCVSSRVERGYKLMRETPCTYTCKRTYTEEREWSAYLRKKGEISNMTSEIIVERYVITNLNNKTK